jgi:organic radical activating enzyme
MIIENLEISSLCNMDCDYCGRRYMKRKGSLMSLEMVNKFGKMMEGKQNSVWLHFWGEPLTHPYLKEIIYILKSYGVNSCFYTNGNLLSHEIIDMLSKSPIKTICVTMNNCNKNELVNELINKCKFQVKKVWVNVKQSPDKDYCIEEYSNPMWGEIKKCFYQDGDECQFRKDNKINITSDGVIVSCIKDYDSFTNTNYQDIKCPFI